ncbi:hypothetical protein HCU01_02300 [Halomonas cupida]|uniref:Uncharacterized protein n=1 Tax=Halomonas cupida TaxID=44933 RepID=A0ABQ0W9E3_9GAMM|nr:hypothetical protein HCU01_02300 [Halomonas cupida]
MGRLGTGTLVPGTLEFVFCATEEAHVSSDPDTQQASTDGSSQDEFNAQQHVALDSWQG